MYNITITFPFKGEYQFVTFCSEQLANGVLQNMGDDLLDWVCSDDKYPAEFEFYFRGKKHNCSFSDKNAKFLDVYTSDEGVVEERNIPWLCLKVENNDRIYKLSDNV